MTAPQIPVVGYVSNEVIALQLKHLSDTIDGMQNNLGAEMRMLRAEVVRRDVYDAERRADQAELKALKDEVAAAGSRLKEEMTTANSRRWAVWLAIAVGVIGIGKDFLTGLVMS
jgi:uncharacterized protein YaaR (DUF327 family)